MAQKKAGSLLTQTERGDENIIPQRFIARLTPVTTIQQVPLDTTTTALSTTVIASKLQQTLTDERKKLTTTIDNPIGTSFVDYQYDPESGVVLPVTEEIVAVPAGGSIPTGINADGTFSEYRGLTASFGLKTTRKASGLTHRTYLSWEHVTLPRVLVNFEAVVFYDKKHLDRYGNDEPEGTNPATGEAYPAYENPYHINPGGNIRQVSFNVELKDFSRQYAVTVEEWWQKDAFLLDGATVFSPHGFSFITPFGGASVPECLHGNVSVEYSTGTTHPVLDYLTGSYSWGPTDPDTCEGIVVIQDIQTPYNGGHRRIKKTITVE